MTTRQTTRQRRRTRGHAARPRRKASSPIVVIGASAGGMQALTRLVAQLPAAFPGPIFLVHHMSADTDGTPLLRALNKSGNIRWTEGKHGEAFEDGRGYLAPSDHHMMLGAGRILITKGARENRARPSIDPLFRSAAVTYGNRVIGVVLTGYLDDGTAGLRAIQRCGGTCVVQDPSDAAYPDMPQNALEQLKVDHCVPIAEMGAVLLLLAQKDHGKAVAVPKDLAIEAKIAERVLSDLPAVEAVGDQVPFNCPGCGGVLWEIAEGDSQRYRCHTGHAFTAPVLLAEQTAKVEETLWVALRMFEERRNLLLNMSARGRPKGRKMAGALGGSRAIYDSAKERATASEVHIRRIRSMLRASAKAAQEDAAAGA